MLRGQEHLEDYCCDSGNRVDDQYYHAGEPRHNPQGRPSSIGSDTEDLVAMKKVSTGKCDDGRSRFLHVI